MSFKRGDRVRVKKSVKRPRWGWGVDMDYDTILVIGRVEPDCLGIDWKGGTSYNYNIHPSEVELIPNINDKINRRKK